MPINKEERIPAHPPIAEGYMGKEPVRFLLMSPAMCTIGALLVFFSVAVVTVVILPTVSMNPPASTNWAPLTNEATFGRAIYLANGCVYCHSAFTRPQDHFVGPYYLYPRVSEPGDYWEGAESPNVFGTARTGPDLSQEGGNHPNDWHDAHYWSPRATTPISIMPRFNWLSDQERGWLITHNQAQGGKEGYLRVATQTVAKNLMLINMGIKDPAEVFPDLVQQLQQEGSYMANGAPSDMSPWGMPWMAVWMVNTFERGYWLNNNPLVVTQQNLMRGKDQFLTRCVGCHGNTGDGFGPAAQFLLPNPFNFQEQGPTGINGIFASDGMLYHRILTAGKGTAMENFGTRLSVEDTWRIVLFLRTIQNGSLAEWTTIPTEDMWEPWTAPEPLVRYIEEHPIIEGPGTIRQSQSDPFMAAAHWASPGLAVGDVVLVGGKLPMDRILLTNLIQSTYMQLLDQAYTEAQDRGDPLPPREEIMSTEGVRFHMP